MARRIYAGLMPDGSYDVRISRPGHDAKTADVSDPTKISFAASRGNLTIAEIISISQLNEWVNFTKTYSDIPRPIVVVQRSYGYSHFLPFESSGQSFGSAGVSNTGSLYVPVVQINRMMIAVPPAGATYPRNIPGGDSFIAFLVA